MHAIWIFSGIAVVAVWLAGRRDAAHDPRLTTLCLALLAVFPMLVAWLPKVPLLPVAAVSGGHGEAGIGWTKLLGWLWLSGFGVSVLRLLVAVRGIVCWRMRSEPVAWVGRVEIRKLAGLRGPVAAGVWRKVVFVPDAWNEWSENARRMAMAHELTHHRRHDPLRRWVAELACAVNWFNPAVAWIARRLALQCEFACDAEVLRGGVETRAYARLLCDCAEEETPRGPLLAMAGPAALESRVRRLIVPSRPVRSRLVGCVIALMLAAAGALAMLGPATRQPAPAPEVYSPREIQTRWAADPFPGEH